MNIPTQTQLCQQIISKRLNWSVLDSDGNPARKPEGMDDLTCLLICHKMGTFRIVAGEPVGPLTVRIKVEGGVAEVWYCPEGVEVEITDHDSEDGTFTRYRVDHNLTQFAEVAGPKRLLMDTERSVG